MERVSRGRVVEHLPVIPAVRQMPHVGDVALIKTGRHQGRAGKVAGRLDMPAGEVRWSVMRDDGVILGQYPPEALSILVEGS